MTLLQEQPKKRISFQNQYHWIWDLLLVVILVAGGYFRFIGINWDDNHHVHPDERFLTMVETSISPVKAGEYFNTDLSTLNPHNVGYSYYVYGTFPLFIVRYVGEWVDRTGYDQIFLVGRFLAGLFDLFTVFLVYLIAYRIYKRPGLSVLAAAFSAFAVLQIQQSHYFTVDSFLTFFVTLSLYFAIRVMTSPLPKREDGGDDYVSAGTPPIRTWLRLSWGGFLAYALFGVGLGMAVASKVSAAPVALLLPVGAAIYYFQLPEAKRSEYLVIIARNVILAAVISVVVFRICQPYAFSGPGSFGVGLNPKWVANLKELASQSTGNVDFPPALQWARRPAWFGWWNMTVWGLGLPLGLLAWLAFLWMGWKVFFRREWHLHLLLWLWVGVYFLWQGTGFVSSMRYLLPIYPAMTVISAWGLFSLWDHRTSIRIIRNLKIKSIAIVLFGAVILAGTALWAYAFSRIYTRTETRVAASEWIYENVPGPINLQIETTDGLVQQPLSTLAGTTFSTPQPLQIVFKAVEAVTITELKIGNLVELGSTGEQRTILATISSIGEVGNGEASYGYLIQSFQQAQQNSIIFQNPIQVQPGLDYELKLEVVEPAIMRIFGKLSIAGIDVDGKNTSLDLPELVEVIRVGKPYSVTTIKPIRSGVLRAIQIPHVVDWLQTNENKTIKLSISDTADPENILAEATYQSIFKIAADPRGDFVEFLFDPAISLEENKQYSLEISLEEGDGAIALYGSRVAVETVWDVIIPLDLGRGNPFDEYSGIYRTDLNFDMYWTDNEDKRKLFFSILDKADYIIMSSNRQWGTTVRVPERYPMTTYFYRHLMGCPDGMDIVHCYSVAELGMFNGDLGYELVNVTTSYPNLGNLEINTQFAEEAFTVYDHPKVMIFRKTSDYDSEKVQSQLGAIDLTRVIPLTPFQASKYPVDDSTSMGGEPGSGAGTLTLPVERLEEQRSGGTWMDLYPVNSFLNRYPGLGVVVWYLVITILGWVAYPVLRIAMKGLADRGFVFSKLAGLLLLTLMVWLAGSLRIPVTRWTITIVFLGLFLVCMIVAYWGRQELKNEFRKRWKYFLVAEIIMALFFLAFLLVRLGNPDLWHPFKGGEKPMDFAYFNAILKSTTFPPYDPWFSGGYINYYYYGFVIVGILTKWLGIIPSIAYNLILPTWFSLEAIGAFGIVLSIYTSVIKQNGNWLDQVCNPVASEGKTGPWLGDWKPILAGLAGSFGVLVLGNLGTTRMIWHGLQRLAAPGGVIEDAGFIQRMSWTIKGLGQYFSGARLPYGWGEWYWVPSRAIPGDTITEFPAFTFLYADLHAHLIALPITILAIAWIFSYFLEGGRSIQEKKWLDHIWTVLLGAIIIGALRPTNTWDFPTYLGMAVLVMLYTGIKQYGSWHEDLYNKAARHTFFASIGSVLALVLFAFVLYMPFSDWYGQGYTSMRLWEGEHSPFWSYVTHWGLFLYVVITWLIWELLDWLSKTPVSALDRLKPYKKWIWVGFLLILVIVIFLQAGGIRLLLPENLRFDLNYPGIQIAWLAAFVALLSFILIFRPGQPEGKKFTLFLVALSFVLTLAVEIIVLQGDVGRMNTVFKFYLQAWTMLGISSASALFWLLPEIRNHWKINLQTIWMAILVLLVGSAALFPLLAGADKIRDRMSKEAPHTLDGMTFMATSHYNEAGYDMDLNQDYLAIQWMQRNITGSPVIVEGNAPLYHWTSRFSIYTGLPTVIGWDWHQIQQRSITPSTWVTNRTQDVADFYTSLDQASVKDFLDKYDVSYIVVGQLERVIYPGEGLTKFETWNNHLWETVYEDRSTVIYRVK